MVQVNVADGLQLITFYLDQILMHCHISILVAREVDVKVGFFPQNVVKELESEASGNDCLVPHHLKSKLQRIANKAAKTAIDIPSSLEFCLHIGRERFGDGQERQNTSDVEMKAKSIPNRIIRRVCQIGLGLRE